MRDKKEDLRKVWIRRFVLSVSAIFFYWVNENFIHLSIHKPTCLLLIGYFFIGLSIVDILVNKILKKALPQHRNPYK